MSSTKNVVVLGITAKAEASYGAGSSHSFAGSNSVKPNDFVTAGSEYAYDGIHGTPPGTYGTQRRTAPSGLTSNFEIPVEMKGNGTGYSSEATGLPNVHDLLRASGLSGSYAANTWSFSPSPQETTPTSIALALYSRGEIRQVSGGYANVVFAADTAAPTIATFAVQGITKIPSDVTLPSITYEADNVIPPKNENIRYTMNFGSSVTGLKVRSYTLDLQREVAPRLDINATGGHAGFSVARRAPKMTVVFEAEALTTIDPESLWNVGTNGSVSLIVGSADGNTFEYTLAQAQIVNVVQGDDGPTATFEVEMDGYASTSDGNDDIAIIAY